MKDIWLIGGRESRTINRLRKRLRSEWGLVVISHWDPSKFKFPHTGKPAFALVLTDWCGHNQLDWLAKERPNLRVVSATRKWAELVTMLEAQGVTPDVGATITEALGGPPVSGLRAAARLLGTSYSAVGRRVRETRGQPGSPTQAESDANETWVWTSEADCLQWWIATQKTTAIPEEEAEPTAEEEPEIMSETRIDEFTRPLIPDLPVPKPAPQAKPEVVLLEVTPQDLDVVHHVQELLGSCPALRFLYGAPTVEFLLQKALQRGLEALQDDLACSVEKS